MRCERLDFTYYVPYVVASTIKSHSTTYLGRFVSRRRDCGNSKEGHTESSQIRLLCFRMRVGRTFCGVTTMMVQKSSQGGPVASSNLLDPFRKKTTLKERGQGLRPCGSTNHLTRSRYAFYSLAHSGPFSYIVSVTLLLLLPRCSNYPQQQSPIISKCFLLLLLRFQSFSPNFFCDCLYNVMVAETFKADGRLKQLMVSRQRQKDDK